ncbi:MAG: hypothetical protein U1E46_15875 [Hyphomicrobiales bacterium]
MTLGFNKTEVLLRQARASRAQLDLHKGRRPDLRPVVMLLAMVLFLATAISHQMLFPGIGQ